MCALNNDFEIRVHKSDSDKTWGLYAQVRSFQDTEGKSLFGKISFGGPWMHLALFTDHPDVQSEIGLAMQSIADSITNDAKTCGLSQPGSSEAWHSAWSQIQWPEA